MFREREQERGERRATGAKGVNERGGNEWMQSEKNAGKERGERQRETFIL